MQEPRFEGRIPTVEEFIALRADAGWHLPPADVIARGLKKTIFAICALDASGKVIGMGRVVGDGDLQLFITDVIVHSDWQERGIGTEIMKLILKRINEICSPGTMINLCAARGKESFYERLGFGVRPNEKFGSGMISFSQKAL